VCPTSEFINADVVKISTAGAENAECVCVIPVGACINTTYPRKFFHELCNVYWTLIYIWMMF